MTDLSAVPAQLRIATRDERIKARLVTTGVVVGVYMALGLVLTVLGDSAFVMVLIYAALLGFAGWWLRLMFAKAQTPGYKVTGLMAVDPRTGAKASGNLFVRHVLQGLVGGVSCGLAEPIVSFVSFGDRGTWFDRTAGVLIVHISSVGAPSATTTATRVATPASAVTPVVAPTEDTPALADPTQLVGHDHGAEHQGAGRGGWEPVVTDYAPIQSVPGRPVTAHRVPESPDAPDVAGAPITEAVPTPVPAPPPAGPVEEPPVDQPADGVITGVPWGGVPPADHAASGAAESAPIQPDPMAHMTPVSPAESAPPATPLSVAAGPAADHTVVDGSLLATTPAPVLRLDDGTRHLVAPALLLGRAPVPLSDHADAMPVAITDPGMKVSKTHLLVVFDGLAVTVTDLGSTNGVRVALPGEQPRRLTAWEAYSLRTGERVHLGDRSFEVSG